TVGQPENDEHDPDDDGIDPEPLAETSGHTTDHAVPVDTRHSCRIRLPDRTTRDIAARSLAPTRMFSYPCSSVIGTDPEPCWIAQGRTRDSPEPRPSDLVRSSDRAPSWCQGWNTRSCRVRGPNTPQR